MFQEGDGEMHAEDERGTEIDDPSVAWKSI